MSDNMEIWRQVVGFEDYEVSNLGGIRRVTYLQPTIADSGRDPVTGIKARGGMRYRRVQLTRKGSAETKKVHALVAEAFLGPRPAGYTVDHKNFDRNDNRAENLEYVTVDENIRRSIAAGVTDGVSITSYTSKKQFHWKLTPEKVAEIKVLLADPNVNMTVIAKQFGVSRETIRHIRAGKTWR